MTATTACASRDHRNAGGQHGQLRARQPTCAAHDLPLRLCRTTLEGAVLGTKLWTGSTPPSPTDTAARDNGQTSAWYVFSALGFYPVCPASDEYAVGSPLFKKALIHLENGETVEIEAPGNGPENRYVGKMTLDGKTLERTFLKYGELLNGAKIAFEMRPEPNDSRGTKAEDAPYSMSDRE